MEIASVETPVPESNKRAYVSSSDDATDDDEMMTEPLSKKVKSENNTAETATETKLVKQTSDQVTRALMSELVDMREGLDQTTFIKKMRDSGIAVNSNKMKFVRDYIKTAFGDLKAIDCQLMQGHWTYMRGADFDACQDMMAKTPVNKKRKKPVRKAVVAQPATEIRHWSFKPKVSVQSWIMSHPELAFDVTCKGSYTDDQVVALLDVLHANKVWSGNLSHPFMIKTIQDAGLKCVGVMQSASPITLTVLQDSIVVNTSQTSFGFLLSL